MQRKQPQLVRGKKHWKCPTCKQLLPEKAFFPCRKTWNKITSQCRICHTQGSTRTRDKKNARRLNREYMRRARKTDPAKYRIRDRLAARKRKKGPAYKARRILHAAVRKGTIVRPLKCETCDKKIKLTAHHEDYNKPLEVEWLCYECHGQRSWKY